MDPWAEEKFMKSQAVLRRVRSPQSRELRSGQPWAGAAAPTSATFRGWVLVQVWEQPDGRPGTTVHWSGDDETVKAAAQELQKAASEL